MNQSAIHPDFTGVVGITITTLKPTATMKINTFNFNKTAEKFFFCDCFHDRSLYQKGKKIFTILGYIV